MTDVYYVGLMLLNCTIQCSILSVESVLEKGASKTNTTYVLQVTLIT